MVEASVVVVVVAVVAVVIVFYFNILSSCLTIVQELVVTTVASLTIRLATVPKVKNVSVTTASNQVIPTRIVHKKQL